MKPITVPALFHPFLAHIYGRGRWHWYDIIILSLALVIVYPDKVLEWMADRTGKEFDLLHLIVLEVLAIGGMVLALVLLMPVYPRLQWWYPVFYVGFLAAFRGLLWLLVGLFGLHDL